MAEPAQIHELKVTGMSCGHCRAAVEAALRDIPGVIGVHVNLEQGRATVEGKAELTRLVEAVEQAGYEAAPAANQVP